MTSNPNEIVNKIKQEIVLSNTDNASLPFKNIESKINSKQIQIFN